MDLADVDNKIARTLVKIEKISAKTKEAEIILKRHQEAKIKKAFAEYKKDYTELVSRLEKAEVNVPKRALRIKKEKTKLLEDLAGKINKIKEDTILRSKLVQVKLERRKSILRNEVKKLNQARKDIAEVMAASQKFGKYSKKLRDMVKITKGKKILAGTILAVSSAVLAASYARYKQLERRRQKQIGIK